MISASGTAAQFSGQRRAQILIIHAFTQIQRRIGLLYLADGQLNDMRGRRGALRNTPLLAHPQQRRFLTGAGHRDTEIVRLVIIPRGYPTGKRSAKW